MNLHAPNSVLLISCYELGHQPLGVALPLGFLQRAGFTPVAMDISVDNFDEETIKRARFLGISVPMHTALRLGLRVAARVREINPNAAICFYGHYAALNAEYLLENGADYCIGGEIETPLTSLVEQLNSRNGERAPVVDVAGVMQRGVQAKPHIERLSFAVPSRTPLPTLDRYARLEHLGESRVTGYAEASRGCLHL